MFLQFFNHYLQELEYKTCTLTGYFLDKKYCMKSNCQRSELLHARAALNAGTALLFARSTTGSLPSKVSYWTLTLPDVTAILWQQGLQQDLNLDQRITYCERVCFRNEFTNNTSFCWLTTYDLHLCMKLSRQCNDSTSIQIGTALCKLH